MKQDLVETRKEIQGLGLNAIREYFNIDPSKLDKEILVHLLQKAKIGLQFEKNKKEMKKLLLKSMAQYIPK